MADNRYRTLYTKSILRSNNNGSKAKDKSVPVYCLFTQLEHTSQEQFKMVMETFRSAHVSKEETTEMVQKLQKAAQDHTSTTSEELAGTVSKTLKSFISQEKKVNTLCTSTVCTLSNL